MANESMKALVAGLLGGVVAGVVARKLLPRDTDVDFRPPPQPQPDVIGGWERKPRVPTSDDIVR